MIREITDVACHLVGHHQRQVRMGRLDFSLRPRLDPGSAEGVMPLVSSIGAGSDFCASESANKSLKFRWLTPSEIRSNSFSKRSSERISRSLSSRALKALSKFVFAASVCPA